MRAMIHVVNCHACYVYYEYHTWHPTIYYDDIKRALRSSATPNSRQTIHWMFTTIYLLFTSRFDGNPRIRIREEVDGNEFLHRQCGLWLRCRWTCERNRRRCQPTRVCPHVSVRSRTVSTNEAYFTPAIHQHVELMVLGTCPKVALQYQLPIVEFRRQKSESRLHCLNKPYLIPKASIVNFLLASCTAMAIAYSSQLSHSYIILVSARICNWPACSLCQSSVSLNYIATTLFHGVTVMNPILTFSQQTACPLRRDKYYCQVYF